MELINSKHFKYIGAWFSYKKFKTRDKEIEARIGCASRSFAQHKML